MSRAAASLRLVPTGPPPPEDALDPGVAFRKYSGYVASIALRLLGRDDEVDDVVQDVFLTALKDLAKLDESAAIRGWLATVTVRMASRKLRLRRLRRFVGLDSGADYTELAASAGQEQAVLVARIYTILDALPADLRVAWSLRYIEGERLDAVANLCGCSLATAKRRILAAQKPIEEALGDA